MNFIVSPLLSTASLSDPFATAPEKGIASRKTPSGPRFHARLESQSGQVYRCEHNHRTENAAVKCANSKAAQEAALAEFAQLDQ